jgi:hypothetical protein
MSDKPIPAFDENAPHGTVAGLPGVRYSQHGNYFNGRFEYVSPEDLKTLERPSQKEKLAIKAAKEQALKEAFKAELAAGTTVNIVEAKPVEAAPANPTFTATPVGSDEDLDVLLDSIDSMHWTQLRKEVEANGGTYEGKDSAVAFLKAKTIEVYGEGNTEGFL